MRLISAAAVALTRIERKSLGNYVDVAWQKAGRELVRKTKAERRQKRRLISRKFRFVLIGSDEAPLQLDCENAITRKHQSQKHRPSGRRDMQKRPLHTVASLCQRDEKHLASHLAKKKSKYAACKEQDAASDTSL